MSDIMQKMTQEEDWRREFWYVVFARRRPILTTITAVLLGSVLIALFWPLRFESSASVLVRGKRADVSPSALDRVELRNPEISDQDVISELEILRSPELARRVAAYLKEHDEWEIGELDAQPDWVQTVKAVAGDLSNRVKWLERMAPRKREGAMSDARLFLRQLDVTRVPSSNVIRLQFAAHSPESAEAALDALLDLYVPYRAEVFNPLGQEAFYETRMKHYRTQLDDLVNRMDEEGSEVNPAFIDMKIKGNLERLVSLQQQLGVLEMELATSSFRDNQPILKRIELVKGAIDDLEKENRGLQRKRLSSESVFREANLIRHSLDTFAQRAEETRISNSIAKNNQAGDISVLSRARGTGELVFPKAMPTILWGLVVSLIAGLSVGFLTEFFDHTVHRPEDVTRNTGLPIIGSLPKI